MESRTYNVNLEIDADNSMFVKYSLINYQLDDGKEQFQKPNSSEQLPLTSMIKNYQNVVNQIELLKQECDKIINQYPGYQFKINGIEGRSNGRYLNSEDGLDDFLLIEVTDLKDAIKYFTYKASDDRVEFLPLAKKYINVSDKDFAKEAIMMMDISDLAYIYNVYLNIKLITHNGYCLPLFTEDTSMLGKFRNGHIAMEPWFETFKKYWFGDAIKLDFSNCDEQIELIKTITIDKKYCPLWMQTGQIFSEETHQRKRQ